MNDVFLLIPYGDGLKVKAPSSAPAPRDWLKSNREDLLFFYRERAAIREIDGGMSRYAAQFAAALDVTEQARRMINAEETVSP